MRGYSKKCIIKPDEKSWGKSGIYISSILKKPTITYRIYIKDFIINIWYIPEMYDFGYILVNLAYT